MMNLSPRWDSMILAALCVLALSGYVVTSDNPLAGFAESEAIPEYLLGSWEFVEFATLDATDTPGVYSDESGHRFRREAGHLVGSRPVP